MAAANCASLVAAFLLIFAGSVSAMVAPPAAPLQFKSSPISKDVVGTFPVISDKKNLKEKNATLMSPLGASYTLMTSLPASFPNGIGAISIKAKVTAAKHTVLLRLEYTDDDGDSGEIVDIPLAGEGVCTDPVTQKCDALGPLCTVDRMHEVVAKITDPDFAARVRPAQLTIRQDMAKTTSTFTEPLQWLWTVAGLYDILGQLPECEYAPIKFTRVPGTQQVATFSWELGTAAPVDLTTPVTIPPSPIDLNLKLPKKLEGWVQIHGSVIDMHFTTGAPYIKFSHDAGGGEVTWFDGESPCFVSSALGAALRHGAYSGSLPSVHLVVEP